MKYEVNKEFLLTANEEEMELLAIAVKNQIIKLAKKYAAESDEIWTYPTPACEFIEAIAWSWFDLFEGLCKAIDTTKSRREYDMTKEVVYYTFEKEKERIEKEEKEAQENFDKIF